MSINNLAALLHSQVGTYLSVAKIDSSWKSLIGPDWGCAGHVRGIDMLEELVSFGQFYGFELKQFVSWQCSYHGKRV